MSKFLPAILLSAFSLSAVAAPTAPETYDLAGKYYVTGQGNHDIELYQINADYDLILWVGVKNDTAASPADIQWIPLFDSVTVEHNTHYTITPPNLSVSKGDELVFRLMDTTTNKNYYSGYLNWNPDGQDHARTYYNYNDFLPEGSSTKALIVFEDGYNLGDHDFNDIMIGVNNVSWQAAAVPEPETYAMLLAGLGIIGAVARRRRNK